MATRSQPSLRHRIALLEADGLLRRRHGSGTYVTDQPTARNDLSRNFGVSEMIAATRGETARRLRIPAGSLLLTLCPGRQHGAGRGRPGLAASTIWPTPSTSASTGANRRQRESRP